MRTSREVLLARTIEAKQKVLDCFDFTEPRCAKDLNGKLDMPYGTYRTYIYHLFKEGYLNLDHVKSQRTYYVKTEETIAVIEYEPPPKPVKEPWRFIPYKIEHLVHDIQVPDFAITNVKERMIGSSNRPTGKVYPAGSTLNGI